MLNGSQLKHLRLIHNLIQMEIANELQITRNYISIVEAGRSVSQEWHDNYVNTIYKLSIKKKAIKLEPTIEVAKEIVEEILEVAKETPKVTPKVVKKTATKIVPRRKPARKTVPKKTIK